ncbi:MAG: Phage tail protein, partial [Rubritepida sp.]|nr:Phage tail protein [Rubritepida sp.]
SESAAQSIASLAAQLGAALGGIKLGGEVAVGVTQSRGDGDVGKLYLDVNGKKGEFSNDEEGAKALAAQASKYLLEQLTTLATGDYAGILNASGGSIEKLQSDLTWYTDVYKKFGETAAAASAYQQALDQVTAAYATNIAKAQELSLSTEAITAARQKDFEAVTAQRDAQFGAFGTNLEVRQLVATGGDTLPIQERVGMMQFDLQAKQQMAQAKATLESWGLSAEMVTGQLAWNEAVLAQERLGVQKQYADQALAIANQSGADGVAAAQQAAQAQQQAAGSALSVVTNLRDYVGSLSTSDASAGTVMDRFGAAGNDFNAIYGAAAAGDANSISGLQGAAETYRGLAREVYGGGQGYADAIKLIGDRIGSIADIGSDALTQSFIRENDRENTDRVVDAIAELRAENVQLRADIKQILMKPAA